MDEGEKPEFFPESLEENNVEFKKENIPGEGSNQDIKRAEILRVNVKEDSAPASKLSSLKSIRSYESPQMSEGSLKSLTSAKGSKDIVSSSLKSYESPRSSIKDSESVRDSTGSVKSEGNVRISKSTIRSHESIKNHVSYGNLQKSVGSKISNTASYGSAGPCKIFDSYEINGSQMPTQESVQEIVEYEGSKTFLQEYIDGTFKPIVRDQSKELANLESPESVTQVSDSSTKTPFAELIPDNEYLKKYLGVPLTHALAEIVIKQPLDPIHYLAHWLFKWRWNQENKQRKEDEVIALNNERQRIHEERQEKERLEVERAAIKEAEERIKEEAKAAVDNIVDRAFITLDI
ncbi:uncharacterized protein [Periplaneta americana]|uniref:uncharacterized protein n=1 Tax=Periplaneta americana TaxID=6978 RepID=UPI0037E75231